MVLITAAMLMMLLCGCRTRVTNNTEVGNMITDDSGMLSESYQTRRDELGIPIAEAPFFKGTGSDEEYDEYDEEYDDFEEEDEQFEDEEEDEDLDEDLEDEDDSTSRRPASTTTTTTSPARRTYPTVVRRPSVTTTTTVKITFNPNGKGAKCLRTSTILRKGSTYGTLPTPTRDGYDFEGWYTDKTKGSKVSSTTKVKDKDHTLYAHWKEVVKKTYKVTFDGNGDEDEVELSSTEISVKEDGTYGKLPSAKRAKYEFKGWFTDAEKGSQITSKTKFTANENQTLYAHWEYQVYKWWNAEYKKAANEIDSESENEFLIAEDSKGDNDKAESFLNDCRIKKAEEDANATFIVKFIENYSDEDADQAAAELSEAYGETAPDARFIIVSTDAIYGSKEEKLLYKMSIFKEVYEGSYDLYEAKYDLHDGDDVSYHVY